MSSRIKPAPLPPDTLIGDYRIVRSWHRAVLGVVYLAKDAQGQEVAIKEYLPAALATRAQGELVPKVAQEKVSLYRLGLKSFFEEGRALTQISHASVVSVLNFFRENETVYMVMNFLRGASLQEYIVLARSQKNAPRCCGESTIRALFDEVLRGLRIVHQHKMLHLDIKPANIFITDEDRAVMIDFGAAREVLNKEGNFIRPMYTPGFAAPEMYKRNGSMGPVDGHLCRGGLHVCLYDGATTGRCTRPSRQRPFDGGVGPLARRVLRQFVGVGGVVDGSSTPWRARSRCLPFTKR